MNTANEHVNVVTRMAPSPTGNFHIGGVRTALYNWIFARKYGGKFILRSEDTDRERSKKEYEDNMLDVFSWLGLNFDEFYRQSDRTPIYQEHLQKLIEQGSAFEAEPSNEDSAKAVIRFKNPNTTITFHDLILGDISFNTEELGDFVIARTIETPVYHLTVVVDDGLSGITHVIRGQEHINNTARQILILEALGFSRPQYAHIPLIMSPRGGKLSKRDPEVIPALEYRSLGILPQAIINFLAFIGWNPGDDREIMSKEEIIDAFDIAKVQRGGGVFNIEKLHWINKQYLNKLDDDAFREYLRPLEHELESIPGFNQTAYGKIIPLIRERTETYASVREMISAGDLNYFFESPEIDKEMLVWKEDGLEQAHRHLQEVLRLIESSQIKYDDYDEIKGLIFPYAEHEGKGSVLWPLRVALSGKQKSPDPFMLASILGRDEVIKRIKHAL